MSFIGQRSSFNVSTNLKTQELKNSQTQSYLLGHNTLCPYKLKNLRTQNLRTYKLNQTLKPHTP